MENSPISQQFGIRLAKLDRQIHASLEEVRRHIQELEEVEQQTRSTASEKGMSFAQLLKKKMEQPPPSASGT